VREVGLLCAATVLCGSLLCWIDATHGAAAVTRVRADAAASRAAGEAEPALFRAVEAERRAQPRSAAVAVSVPARAPVLLVGRCLALESGAPLEACALTVTPLAAGGPVLARGLAAADGSFELRLEPGAPRSVRLALHAEGRARLQGAIVLARARVELGELGLPLEARLAGRLRGLDGHALAGVSLRVTRTVSGLEGQFAAPALVECCTDSRGSFALDGLAHGAWSVRGLAERPRLVPMAELALEPCENAFLELVAETSAPAGTITGRVRSYDGRALARVELEALDPHGQRAGGARTGEDGAFELVCQGDPSRAVTLSVTHARGHEPLTTAALAWGSHGVDLRLAPAGEIELDVESADGAPVEEYALVWRRAGVGGAATVLGRAPATEHPLGRTILADIPAGAIELLVLPADAALAPGALSFVASPGRTNLRATLAPSTAWRVHVQDAGGQPVAGARVELLEGSALSLASAPIEAGERPTDIGEAVRLASAVTDARGESVLRAGPRRAARALRVTSTTHRPFFSTLGVDEEPPTVVVVSRGACLTGTLEPPEVLTRLRVQGATELALEAVEAATGRVRSAPLATGGEFTFTGLASGAFELRMVHARKASGHGTTWQVHTLARLVLAADEVRCERLDIGVLAPARLSGRVLLDGLPAARRGFQLVRLVDEGESSAPEFGPVERTDEQGRFEVAALAPGRYALLLDAGAARALQVSEDVVELFSGADACQDFPLWSARLHVQIVDEVGRARVGASVELVHVLTGLVASAATEADGWARFDTLTAGRHSLCVVAPAEWASAPPATLELRAGGVPEFKRHVVVAR
jgi:hypothetical protein